MSITGIISEYNPFHKGHYHLINLHKKIHPHTKIVAVMSGNCTQRGEFPLLDKFTRAKLAVQQGVDLVLELPTAFACNSAQYFAQGGVALLNQLGVIDTIICGCENITTSGANIQVNNTEDLLLYLAKQLSNPQLQGKLKEALSSGSSYAHSLSTVLTELSTDRNIPIDNLNKILSSPNATLALSYQQALLSLNSKILLKTYPRIGSDHNDTKARSGFASGTAIRQWAYGETNLATLKNVVPPYTYEILTDNNLKFYPQDMWIFNILAYKLATINARDLRKIQNIREGLEFKIHQAITTAHNLQELLSAIKSKRYTYTNLQRTIMYILLDLTKEDMAQFIDAGPLYARVLAFNDAGQKILAQMKKESKIPLITKLSKYLNPKTPFQKEHLSPMEKMLSLDVKASDLYYQACGQRGKFYTDFTTSPIKVE